MRQRMILAVGAVSLVLLATACGSSGTASTSTPPIVTSSTTSLTVPSTGAASTAPTSTPQIVPVTPPQPAPTTAPSTSVPAPAPTSGAAVNPNAPELVEPGDIPDNQVFVAFASADGTYSVKVPEGWARTETGGVVVFSDKYNSVTIGSSASTAVPTVDNVKTSGLTDVSSDPTFRLIDVQPITRKAGEGVLATYEIGSVPNPVTGKSALLAVERYVFSHKGTTVVLTLSGAKGADNVDPWKVVSDSLTWIG